MKYPQLVSARAVNAISDWLVSRLEQLGVEAPQIYTRLLLSLLQSTVQINDPNEFSNLEAFFVRRKGHNRRYLTCDTDTLKKLNAVQCLREIVSLEHEIGSIENLVDELCEKLKDIERQSNDVDDEERLLLTALVSQSEQPQQQEHQQQQYHHQRYQNHYHHHHHHHHQQQQQQQHLGSSGHSHQNHQQQQQQPQQQQQRHGSQYKSQSGNNLSLFPSRESALHTQQLQHPDTKGRPTITRGGIGGNSSTALDFETDPRKRYFRAFPALTKEMEDSFRVWRRNAKSLTWPVDRNSISTTSSSISNSSSSSSSTLSTSFGAGATKCLNRNTDNGVSKTDADAKLNLSTDKANFGENLGSMPQHHRDHMNPQGHTYQSQQQFGHNYEHGAVTTGTAGAGAGAVITAATGVRRKTKRRRNQTLSKGKMMQNVRRTSSGIAAGGLGGGVGSKVGVGVGSGSGGRQTAGYRHSSPTYWDTDFEGCWEMGRDLIKEFLVAQSKVAPRNRSTSESAAYKARSHAISTIDAEELGRPQHRQIDEDIGVCVERQSTAEASKASSPLFPAVDISFCCEDDDDADDYDDTLVSISELPKDASLDASVSASASASATGTRRLYERELQPEDAAETGQLDFAQFKAKFNSSVEALWRDVEPQAITIAPTTTIAINDDYSLMPEEMQLQSLPTVTPFQENLRNFWSSYYKHHSTAQTEKRPAERQQVPPHQLQQQQQLKAFRNEQEQGVKMSCSSSGSGSGTNLNAVADMANTSDYYSMPSNLDDFDMSGGGGGSGIIGGNGAAWRAGDRSTPQLGVWSLQNTIWSENSNTAAGDTDESFYLKVWNSSKPTSQQQSDMTPGTQGGGGMLLASSGVPATEENFCYTPYDSAKWSEGINAGPVAPQQARLQIIDSAARFACGKSTNHAHCNKNKSQSQRSGVDCVDSSGSACSSGYTYHHIHSGSASTTAYNNWQRPVAGQSLQVDVQSWSTSNPVSLTEMYEMGADSASSIYMTSSGGSGNGVAGGITAAAWQYSISLPNHSTTGSGFVEYARIKPVLKRLQQEQLAGAPPGNSYAPSMLRPREYYSDVDENLLTSERTHFHPIKSYADGHTFDICSELDVIEYERSESGCQVYDGDRYLEYTRHDTFMTEDDGAAGTAASATPLYAASNCEAASTFVGKSDRHRQLQRQGKRNHSGDFVIRFRMRNSEVGCQTESVEFAYRRVGAATAVLLERTQMELEQGKQLTRLEHPLLLVLSGMNPVEDKEPQAIPTSMTTTNTTTTTTITTSTNTNSNYQPRRSDPLLAVNLSITAAAKVTLAKNDFTWSESRAAATPSAYYDTTLWQEAQQPGHAPQDEGSCMEDEVDFANTRTTAAADISACSGSGGDEDSSSSGGCIGGMGTEDDSSCSTGSTLEKQWSMREIGKKCQLKSHNNNNNVSSSSSGGGGGGGEVGAHSLWGMCAACNNDLRSVPANRLLCDELKLEGDEIMSDLKYMQDLYIGRAEGSSEGAPNSGSEWDPNDTSQDVTDDGNSSAIGDQSADGPAIDGIRRKNFWTTLAQTGIATFTDNSGQDCVECTAFLDSTVGAAAADRDGDTEKKAMFQEPQEMLQKVNRLLANLLHPEQSALLKFAADDEEEHDAKPFSGNLWIGKNERNIWQLDATGDSTTTTLKPIELLRHFHVEPQIDALLSDDHFFTAHLDWEHNNLAEIWKNSANNSIAEATPITLSLEPVAASTECNADDHNELLKPAATLTTVAMLAAQQTPTLCSAGPMKSISSSTPAAATLTISSGSGNASFGAAASLQHSATDNPEPEKMDVTNSTVNAATSAAISAYKRVQQFLTSNGGASNVGATKLKLANRKRRHSASQNYYHHHSTSPIILGVDPRSSCIGRSNITATNKNNNNNNNNNNVNIADLNCFNLKQFMASGQSGALDDGGTTGTAFNTNDEMKKLINATLYQNLLKSGNTVNNNRPEYDSKTAAGVVAKDCNATVDGISVRGCDGDRSGNSDIDGVGGAGDGGDGDGDDIGIRSNNDSLQSERIVAALGDELMAAVAAKHTIITCKYWATIEPTMAAVAAAAAAAEATGNAHAYDLIEGNASDTHPHASTTVTFPYLMEKNSSILKHVTMVTRPLTR